MYVYVSFFSCKSIGILLCTFLHACAQVFTRLQKLQLCTSHMAMLKTLDVAAEGHDEKVFDWQDTHIYCSFNCVIFFVVPSEYGFTPT